MATVADHGGLSPVDYQEVARAIGLTGLALRGAFHPQPQHEVPCLSDGGRTSTLVLLGFTGRANWAHFSRSREAADGQPHPLDRWSRRVIDQLASSVGAEAVYPFPTDRPPYFPFQRWAQAADAVHVSPVRLLIHPDWGLWHSYRGALLFTDILDLPPRDNRPSPCVSCIERPCLSTCPTGAFEEDTFSTPRCLSHLQSVNGADCLGLGCRARRACPVATQHHYLPAEASLHMGAFLAQQSLLARR